MAIFVIFLLMAMLWLPVTAGQKPIIEVDTGYVARPLRPSFLGDHLIFNDVPDVPIACQRSCPDIPLWPWHYVARDEFTCPIAPLGKLASDTYTAGSFSSLTVDINDLLYEKSWVALCVYQDGEFVDGRADTDGVTVPAAGDEAELWVFTFTVVPDACLLEPCMGSTGSAQYTAS